MNDTLAVVVLAGGEGRRMGGVKALRPFRGAPLVAHAVALARRWSDEVAVVVREAGQVAGAVEVPLAFDRAGLAGPLAGLAGGLAYAESRGRELLLVLPCDMPNLPADLARRLGAALGPQQGAAFPVVAGELQPVCGLWRIRALDQLAAYVAAGRSSLRGFGAACGLACVDFGAEAAAAFANANTLEDMERLARGAP